MLPDPEQAHERTNLLLQTANDRRLSAIQHDGEAQSILSHVSKEEQALAQTTVGERLPYNDYTTIDWLHDLVRILSRFPSRGGSDKHRSKTRSGHVRYIPAKVYVMSSLQPGTVVRDG